MKLIVGLGNPGKEYENTRHNMGFMFLDYYLNEYSLLCTKEKFGGMYIYSKINGEKVIFLKPLSYMNLSGIVVKKYIDYFKIDINDILILCDDLDLDLGRVKLKYKGSSGGHNGLKSIENNIGSSEYKRLKLGIGNNKNTETKDYVLSKFSNDDLKIIDSEKLLVKQIIDDYFSITFEQLMSKYNRNNIEGKNV